jgi:hypothetical protein
MFGLSLGATRVTAAALLATAGLACSSDASSGNTSNGGATAGSQASGGAAGKATGGTPSAGNTTGGSGSAQGGVGGSAGDAMGGVAAGSGGTAGGGVPSNPASFCEARAGLAFCEDFEAFEPGAVAAAGPWSTALNGEGTVSIDETQSHSGKRALRVFGSGFSSFLVYRDAKVLPAATGRFYLRAFIRLTEAMTGGHNTFIIGDMAASPGSGNAFRLGEMYQMLMYTVTDDSHGALANENFHNDQMPGAALEAASWGCLEMLIDSATPELRVWLGGNEIPDLHHTDFPVDPYDALRFGFEKYAGPESEIFYDDLAIGSQPIGCD